MMIALPPELAEAIGVVAVGHARRIGVPGQWKVWREGDQVKFELPTPKALKGD